VLAEEDAAFDLVDGTILWAQNPIAKLGPGPTILQPKIHLLVDDGLRTTPVADALKAQLTDWLIRHTAKKLGPLEQLVAAGLSGPGQGLIFQLRENLGFVARTDVGALVKALSKPDRQYLARRGVRIGRFFVFLPAMLKKRRAVVARQLANAFGGTDAPAPPDGRVSFDVRPNDDAGILRTCGYWMVDQRAVRVDSLERLGQALAMIGPKVATDPNLLSIVGFPRQGFPAVMRFVGYRPIKPGSELFRRAPQRISKPKKNPLSPFSVLADLPKQVGGTPPQ
jgi:ATP-dependent RNA helicase SUPV3L1/SUV3